MRMEELVESSSLSADWESILRIELLTGCSKCERRILHNEQVRGGTTVVRIQDADGAIVGVYALCKECCDGSVFG